MSIQETVNEVLVNTRNKEIKNALRVLKAEFQREKNKTIDDARAVKIIKTLIASEQERLSHINTFEKGKSEDKANGVMYIHVLASLLPVAVGEEQIREWIVDNVDFSKFKNPLQAIKVVADHFGFLADGTTIKKVIEELNK